MSRYNIEDWDKQYKNSDLPAKAIKEYKKKSRKNL